GWFGPIIMLLSFLPSFDGGENGSMRFSAAGISLLAQNPHNSLRLEVKLLFCPSGAWSFSFTLGRGVPARRTCGRLEDTMMLPG
ncbi:MAG TPA: hypothetical protein VFU27_08005, partial [Terriglobales bacterium]|nr:hypothetical protein [Terriglobales bacterium]